MPDTFDEHLAAAAARLEQEAAVRSPAGVRARGDQRRRRRTATMTVVPVAVLAIAGTVGLTFRPSGAGGSAPGVRTSTGRTAPGTSASPAPGTPAAAGPAGTVDLAHHTLAVLDTQGKVVKTLGITAGMATHPTPTGTFTVVDKASSKKISSSGAGSTYNVTVADFIDLGPNGPAIYAAPWPQAKIGKENTTHGDIGLSTDDAAWLFQRLAVGDTIQITGDPA